MPKKIMRVYWWFLGIWFLIILLGLFTANESSYEINKSEIVKKEGCSYAWVLDKHPIGWPIMAFNGDSSIGKKISTLRLFENDQRIGKPHSLHSSIQTHGAGSYSHWNQTLYFSAADCSDPTENGRIYHVTVKPFLSRGALGISLVAVLIGLFLIIRSLRNNHRLFKNLILSSTLFEHKWGGLALCLLLCTCAAIFLLLTWDNGQTISLAIAGYFQISDASGYWLCSNVLLDLGNFGPDLNQWCQRRSIYPHLLSGISLLGQRDIFFVLMIQAMIVCVAIFLFTRQTAYFIGIIGAVLCATLLCIYSQLELHTLTMTTNAGLVFGCIGFALLLRSAGKLSTLQLVIGISLISVGLNARAGAFFVLPALVAWAGIVAPRFDKSRMLWVIAATLAILSGFLLQSILVLSVGGDPTNSHGNFSYVLYGLSEGGKSWSQVYIDHPEILSEYTIRNDGQTSKTIYRLAFNNILHDPTLILQGFKKNFFLYLERSTYGTGRLGDFGFWFKVAWWIAWIPIFINRKKPVYVLTGICSLGIVVSSLFLLTDGAARVFSATLPIDVLQVGIGATWLFVLCFQFIKIKFASKLIPDTTKIAKSVIMEYLLVGLLLLLIAIPHTPIDISRPLKADRQVLCNEDQLEVHSKLGAGTLLLDIRPEERHSNFVHGQQQHKNLMDGLPAGPWWHDTNLDNNNQSILTTYQQNLSTADAGKPYRVFTNQPLSDYHGQKVSLCLGKQTKLIFENTYYRLESISIIN